MVQDTCKLELEMELTSVVNYALQQNRLPVVREITIKNNTDKDLSNVILRIESEPQIISTFSQIINTIPAQETLSIKTIALTLNHDFLAALTERVVGTIHVILEESDMALAEKQQEFIALAFDEWHGASFFPRTIDCFCNTKPPRNCKNKC